MSIRLLAIDLDGTTLRNDTTLSLKVKEALEYVLSKQVAVVPCTGRVLDSLPAEITAIPGISFVVTSNGAAIDHLPSGKRVYQNLLNRDTALSVLDAVAGNDVMIEVFIAGRAYTEVRFLEQLSRYGTAPEYVQYVMSTRKPVEDIRILTEETCIGIENINLKIADDVLRNQIWHRLNRMGTVALTSSFRTNIEVSALGTDKAQAIAWLCRQMGCTMDKVMAIGDSLNDVALLERAGISVAMENGVQQVKQAANFITLSNGEDGVAHAIHKFYNEEWGYVQEQ